MATISKNEAISVFEKADSFKDYILTKKEIDEASKTDALSPDQSTFLKDTFNYYNKHKNDDRTQRDKTVSGMDLLEYMDAVSKSTRSKIFKQRDRGYAYKIMSNNKYCIIERIKSDPYDIEAYNILKRWSDDKDVVITAAKYDGSCIYYASERLRDDDDVVLTAVKQNGRALFKASKRLRDNKEIVMGAVTNNGQALEFASNRLRDDKEIVMKAVKQYGISHDDSSKCALSFASDRLKDDKDIVLAAVKKWGSTLSQASDRLKDDEEVVLEAIKNYDSMHIQNSILEIASTRLREDKTFVIKVIKQRGVELCGAAMSLKDDDEVVMEAIRQDGTALGCTSKRLRNDKNVALEAVQYAGIYARYSSGDKLHNDPDIIEAQKQFETDHNIYDGPKPWMSKIYYGKLSYYPRQTMFIRYEERHPFTIPGSEKKHYINELRERISYSTTHDDFVSVMGAGTASRGGYYTLMDTIDKVYNASIGDADKRALLIEIKNSIVNLNKNYHDVTSHKLHILDVMLAEDMIEDTIDSISMFKLGRFGEDWAMGDHVAEAILLLPDSNINKDKKATIYNKIIQLSLRLDDGTLIQRFNLKFYTNKKQIEKTRRLLLYMAQKSMIESGFKKKEIKGVFEQAFIRHCKNN